MQGLDMTHASLKQTEVIKENPCNLGVGKDLSKL